MSNHGKDRLDRLAALGLHPERDIPTPPGEEKMSAVILQLAEPLLKRHGKTAQQVEAIISLAVAGWNKSLLPPDHQPEIEKELIDCFVPKDGNAEDVGVAIHFMDFVADRRAKLFPDLCKLILDFEVVISGGHLTLGVTSAPLTKKSGST